MGGQGSLRLLIIADDLTGSNDAGAQFAKRGIRSIVIVDAILRRLPADYPVVVVNTESRHVPADEAARRVAHVTKLGIEAGVPHFFKKTDSTLRGNIGAELKALLDATGERTIPFVPAFPEMGRITRSGIHYVDGVPIAETAFGRDPLSPVRFSDVRKVLQANADISAITATVDSLPATKDVKCIVLDCESREGLRTITECFRRRNQIRVLAGSAAFVEELPNIIFLPRNELESIKPVGHILFVNGSLNPRAFDQAAAVSSRFTTVRLTPENVAGDRLNLKVSADHEGNVFLGTLSERDDYPLFRDRAVAVGIPESDLHSKVAEANGRAVKYLLEQRAFRTLIVIGGDTLMGISRAMGWSAFLPFGELEPGVTVARPAESDLLVISKAGGFGDVEVMHRIVSRIIS